MRRSLLVVIAGVGVAALAACGGATGPGGTSLAGTWAGTIGNRAVGMRLTEQPGGTAVILNGDGWVLTPEGDTTFGVTVAGSARMDQDSVWFTLTAGPTLLQASPEYFRGSVSVDRATFTGNVFVGPTLADTIRNVIFRRGTP